MNKRFPVLLPVSFAALFAFACGDDADPGFDAGSCAFGACLDASPADASTPDAADGSIDAGPCALPGSCPESICGNGVLETGEQCDDMGTAPGDGCSATCQLEEEPGEPTLLSPAPGSTLTGSTQVFTWSDGGHATRQYDFHVGSTPGGEEYLDTDGLGVTREAETSGLAVDGSTVFVRLYWTDDEWESNDFNDYMLVAHTEDAGECGDGTRNTGEQCDDGNVADGDGCSATCRRELDGPVGEGEVGGASPTSICGNGTREPTEQCDDGNTSAGDGCNATCSIEGAIAAGAYYVSTNGDDTNDGMSEAQALRTIQHGIGLLSAGDTLYVKAGDYGRVEMRISASGTESAPIVVEGYRETPGDNPRIVNFDHTSEPDASVMPLLDGSNRGSGRGITVTGDYVVVKNFQVHEYNAGGTLSGNHGVFDNIIASKFGVRTDDYDGSGFWLRNTGNTLRNSVMVDAGGQGITLVGSGNLVEFTKIYGTSDADANGMDYYFIISGQPDPANDHVVMNNYMERVGSVAHVGHGFTVKGIGERNLFENNTAVNMGGGGFVARHSGARNNIYRNNTILGGDSVLIRDGASDNLFENFIIRGSRYGIMFSDVLGEDLPANGNGGHRNTLRNFVLEDIQDAVIFFVGYGGAHNAVSRDNVIENITHTGGTEWMFWGDHYSENNVIRDSTFEDVERWALSRYITVDDLDVTFEDSTCTDCGFELP